MTAQADPPLPTKRLKQHEEGSGSLWHEALGLPAAAAEKLKVQRGITQLYDWQCACLLRPRVIAGDNLLYTAPTSGGKTLVAEILALRTLITRQANVIFVVPYVAIAEEKAAALSSLGMVSAAKEGDCVEVPRSLFRILPG